MPSNSRDVPGEFRIVGAVGPITLQAAEDGDGPKLPTFSMLAYTGAPMNPEGWWDPVVIDLAGVKVPSPNRPILRQHDHTRIVGHSTQITVTDKGIEAAGIVSGVGPDAKEVVELARNGFPWQASIGANPIRREYLESGKKATVNGREIVGPIVISRETELGEISFVPLGADGDTSATVQGSKGKGKVMGAKAAIRAMKNAGNVRAAKYSDTDIEKMSDEEAKAALKKCMAEDDEDTTEAADEDEADDRDEDTDETKASAKASARLIAARKAEAKEYRRINEIKARCQAYGVHMVKLDDGRTVDLIPHAIEAGWSANRAELVARRNERPAGPMGVSGGLVYSTTPPNVTDAVLEAAVLHAARHQFKLEDDEFYHQPTPDGKGMMRRVPLYLQREAQAGIKARYTDQVQQAAHTLFKGRIAPKQIITAAFASWGHRRELDLSGQHGVESMLKAWSHYDQQDAIRAEGASNLSISNILSNVMNKFALQGYLFTEQAWREFVAIRPVNDFKPTKSINLLGDVMFKQIGSSGELENASLGDQAFANQAAPFGRILTMPWTHIVNDDLGMLTGAPMKIGQGSGLALNDAIWSLMKSMAAGTVNGDDNNPFWRTTSSVTAAAMKAGTAYKPNKMSGNGSVFGDTALKTAKALFDNQIDPNGNPLGFDGLVPILLHGPTLWRDVTAQMMSPAIVYGGQTAALAPAGNPWQGGMKPVMSRYVENANYVNSATAFWLLFNPVALAVIEACFINGVDTPAVLQAGPDYQFDRLGISIRGTMPFGVNQQNFRGGVYSVGA